MKVVRTVRELYSEVTEVTASVITMIIPKSQPPRVVTTGSNRARTASFQLSCVMPEMSAIAAENPIESPIASAAIIQVDRTERSLVHSDCRTAPKPGDLNAFEALFEITRSTEMVVDVM